MINSVLVVCVGNICRSPIGGRILHQALPNMNIHSAGLAAVVGAPADSVATEASHEIGVDLEGHIARQLTNAIGAAHDLILVMEPGHRSEIGWRFPQLSGRTMLFDHWTRGTGIADPYRKPIKAHRATRDLIVTSAAAWVQKLGKSPS